MLGYVGIMCIEINMLAHALAKHCISIQGDTRVFFSLPSFCSGPFLTDSAATTYRRGM